MPQPEPISPEDISDALDAIGEDPDDPTFGEIGKLAVEELEKRLTEHPEELPGTDLIKFVTAYFKAKSERQIPGTADQHFSLLEQVDALPTEHAQKLLKAEIAHLHAELERYEQKLEEIGK